MSIEKDYKMDKKLKKDIGLRIKTLRDSLEMPQKGFSERFSTYQSTIANIERGKIYPNMILIYQLVTEFRVNPVWLFTGEGEMFFQSEAASGKNRILLDDRYLEIIEFMKDPAMEQIMFGKMLELKHFCGGINQQGRENKKG